MVTAENTQMVPTEVQPLKPLIRSMFCAEVSCMIDTFMKSKKKNINKIGYDWTNISGI